MRITIIVLLFIKVTAFHQDTTDHNFKGLVSNGEPYDVKAFPFVVTIKLFNDDLQSWATCTGSMLTDTYVITAAHCVTEKKMKNIKVYLGTSRGNKDYRRVIRLVTHRDYDPESEIVIGDLSMFQLKKKFHGKTNIVKIGGNPSEFKHHKAVRCTNIGFGRINEQNDMGEIGYMMSTDVRHGPTDCEGYVSVQIKDTWDRYLCSTANSTTMVCEGDSGGPMVCNGKLYGTCSFFINYVGGKNGCGVYNMQTVHVFLNYYLKWINNVLEGGDGYYDDDDKKNKKKKKKKNSGNSTKPHYKLRTLLAILLLLNVSNII